jgi:hypothetical protein
MKWFWESVPVVHEFKWRFVAFHDDNIAVWKLPYKGCCPFEDAIQVIAFYVDPNV